MQEHYLALDLGSTFTKCALIDINGVLDSRQVPSPAPILRGGTARYEVDANAYMRQAEEMLSQMRDPDTIGVLISTQMHGFVLADADGCPLTPYISWQDQIGGRHLASTAALLGPEATSASGVPLKPNLALCALLGRVREGMQIPEGAWFHTLGGYLIFCLTGKHVCHMTNAAPTGLADVREGEWNRALLHKAGLHQLVWPRIERSFMPVGHWQGLAVYPDLGDQQACAYGADPGDEDTLCIAMGTTGLIGILSEQWGMGEYENRPWIWPGTYLRTVTSLPGGRDLEALKRFVQAMGAAVSKQMPSEEETWKFLCNVTGTKQPWKNLSAWQAAHSTPEQFVLALYEEMAEKYCKAVERIGIWPRRLAFIGGVANKNAALRSAIIERFSGMEVSICKTMDGMQALVTKIHGEVKA